MARASSRRARIQSALHAAHELGLISDAVLASAAAMASYIRDDFAHPTCAVELQRIARDRGRDASTIRRHNYALVRAGLVEDHTAANGWRGSLGGGRLVLGVSFGPTLDRLDDLRRAVRVKRDEESRLLGLRRLASSVRRGRAARREVNWLAQGAPIIIGAPQTADPWDRRMLAMSPSK